jgi:hypothetical protein
MTVSDDNGLEAPKLDPVDVNLGGAIQSWLVLIVL